MGETDVCYAPVLSLREAPNHAHNAERKTFIDVGGATQPAPAPRYSKTILDTPRKPVEKGENTQAILQKLGYSEVKISELTAAGVIAP